MSKRQAGDSIIPTCFIFELLAIRFHIVEGDQERTVRCADGPKGRLPGVVKPDAVRSVPFWNDQRDGNAKFSNIVA